MRTLSKNERNIVKHLALKIHSKPAKRQRPGENMNSDSEQSYEIGESFCDGFVSLPEYHLVVILWHLLTKSNRGLSDCSRIPCRSFVGYWVEVKDLSSCILFVFSQPWSLYKFILLVYVFGITCSISGYDCTTTPGI